MGTAEGGASMSHHAFDAATARRLFRLDEELGQLYWQPRPVTDFSYGIYSAERNARSWNARYAGKAAGTLNANGYFYVAVWYRKYLQHRVIWLMVHGYWPPDEIDHDDQSRQNNRPNNLKSVTHVENCKNCSLQSNNTSGHVGVSFRKKTGKWRAHISIRGKFKELGCFYHKADAIAARVAAAAALGFNPNHGKTAPVLTVRACE